jgi:hypothetical protein
MIQKAYTLSIGYVLRHQYVYSVVPGGVRSVPRGVETPITGGVAKPPREHPVEGSTSAISLAPVEEPASRTSLEPTSPI